MDRNEQRIHTEMNLERELNKIRNNYMKVWDEYYETGSRHSAFFEKQLKELNKEEESCEEE